MTPRAATHLLTDATWNWVSRFTGAPFEMKTSSTGLPPFTRMKATGPFESALSVSRAAAANAAVSPVGASGVRHQPRRLPATMTTATSPETSSPAATHFRNRIAAPRHVVASPGGGYRTAAGPRTGIRAAADRVLHLPAFGGTGYASPMPRLSTT